MLKTGNLPPEIKLTENYSSVEIVISFKPNGAIIKF